MVTRCICHDVSFERVSAMRSDGYSLEAITEQTGCGTGCGTCKPYLRLVMLTGRTAFPVLSPEQAKVLSPAPTRQAQP